MRVDVIVDGLYRDEGKGIRGRRKDKDLIEL